LERIVGNRTEENFNNEIIIEKVVNIRSDHFSHFEKNLFGSYEFLKKHKHLMYYDEQGRSHEILVTSRSVDYGVSVQTNGKDFPESCMVISKIGLFE